MTHIPKHLSYSRLNTYLTCGRRYYYRYIRNLVMPPPGVPLTLGLAIDESINRNYKEKIKSGKDEPLSTLTDVFVEDLRARKDGTDWGDENINSVEKEGVEMVSVFRDELAPGVRNPISVQQKVTIDFENRDWQFVGYIDLIKVDEVTTIVDHKTSRKKPSAGDTETHPQLTAYASAYQATYDGPIPDVGIETIVRPLKTKPARTFTEYSERKQGQVNRWWRTVDAIYESIMKEVFNPAPPLVFGQPNRNCTPEMCGYYQTCMKEF